MSEISKAFLAVASMLEAGGPGSGPRKGSGSYPTQAQSDRAVAQSKAEISTAKQNLDRAMARDISQDPQIQSLQKQLGDLDAKKAEITKQFEAKKAAIAQKYAAKKAAADAEFDRKMREAS